MIWYVYLLKCSDGTIYTGITNDIERRLKQHNSGKGSKYTRGRLPVMLLKSFSFSSKGDALKAEYRIKQMSHDEKIDL